MTVWQMPIRVIDDGDTRQGHFSNQKPKTISFNFFFNFTKKRFFSRKLQTKKIKEVISVLSKQPFKDFLDIF